MWCGEGRRDGADPIHQIPGLNLALECQVFTHPDPKSVAFAFRPIAEMRYSARALSSTMTTAAATTDFATSRPA